MKTIIITLAVTLSTTVLIASLFLNTILGVFGMAATTIETLDKLRTSQQVVDRMKKRHTQKKSTAPKKYAKKSTKRIASSALAAATIGTVAVALTVTYLEIDDYCEEKRELQEDGNILYGTNTEFDHARCIEEGKNDSKQFLAQLKTSSSEAVSSALNRATEYSADKWAEIKDDSLRAASSGSDYMSELWDTSKSWLMD